MYGYDEQAHIAARARRDEIRTRLQAGYREQVTESQLEALDQASARVDSANVILRRSKPSVLDLRQAHDYLSIAEEIV